MHGLARMFFLIFYLVQIYSSQVSGADTARGRALEIFNQMNQEKSVQKRLKVELGDIVRRLSTKEISSAEDAETILLAFSIVKLDSQYKSTWSEALSFFKESTHSAELICFCKKYSRITATQSLLRYTHPVLDILAMVSAQQGISFDLQETYLTAGYDLQIILEPHNKSMSIYTIPRQLHLIYDKNPRCLLNFFYRLQNDGFLLQDTGGILYDLFDLDVVKTDLLEIWLRNELSCYRPKVLDIATKLYYAAIDAGDFENRFYWLHRLYARHSYTDVLLKFYDLEPDYLPAQRTMENITQEDAQQAVLNGLRKRGKHDYAQHLAAHYHTKNVGKKLDG